MVPFILFATQHKVPYKSFNDFFCLSCSWIFTSFNVYSYTLFFFVLAIKIFKEAKNGSLICDNLSDFFLLGFSVSDILSRCF